MNINSKFLINTGLYTVVLFLLMMYFGQPFYKVSFGNVGIETCYGAVRGAPLEAGTGVKLPWCEITEMHVQARSISDIKISAPTIDLQLLDGTATVQYTILGSAAAETYQVVGLEGDVENTIIFTGLQEAAKAVTAHYTGTDLFYQREKAQQDMALSLQHWVDVSATKRGYTRLIEIQGIQLTAAHFTKIFEDALQNKAVRSQELDRADSKRKTQVQGALGEAAKITRNAEAEANNIRLNADAESQAMTQKAEQLAKNPELLCYLARSKWHGRLSDTGHGKTPFDQLCDKK